MRWATNPNGGFNMSQDSVDANYDPVDDNTDIGFRRPPKRAGCVLDYFAALGKVEDDGEFAHSEAKAMLADPASFFPKEGA